MLVPLFAAFFCIAAVSASSVSVERPIEDQLPLIARINAPYAWSFSPATFASSSNASLVYAASSLPAWLSFDPQHLSLQGTPAPADEGSPEITITARDPVSDASASSRFTICVTHFPAPALKHAVEDQFKLPNPSLSSVFLVSPHSALKSPHPALRIPPAWSFSIGFQYDTFVSSGSLYYYALQADGSPLPDWVNFNPRSITFDGYTPSAYSRTLPHTFSLALHGSDQEGYSATSLPFDIVVAEHELSLATSSLPTINITAATPFSVTLSSPADFSGVLLDDKPIQPSDIVTLEIDTSYYGSWLDYNTATRTLSGTPPDSLDGGAHNPLLQVMLATSVNQTIATNVSLAVVPSYFSSAALQPILVTPGQQVNFNLSPFFSNATGVSGNHDDVDLTATYDPQNAGNFLKFDAATGLLSGTVPADYESTNANANHITVAFTAYSHVTHSTSHTKLPVSLSESDFAHQHSQNSALSAAARAKLLFGLKIAFGAIGGLIALGLALAGFRRLARVQDTALQGEAGMRAWTEDEKKWYGIGIEVDGDAGLAPKSEYGYGWSESAAHAEGLDGKYGSIGVGLSRVLTRSLSNPLANLSPRGGPQSPRVMRKVEFVGKIKATARQVSDTVRVVGDRYKRAVIGSRRPVISKPVLMDDGTNAQGTSTLRRGPNTPSPRHPDVAPFDDLDLSRYAQSGLTSIADSPSSSTGGRSIPRRRADFAPPKSPLVLTTPPQAHLSTAHARRRSVDSNASSGSSLATNSSSKTHAAEAVVQRAERATSVRSMKSIGGVSTQSQQPDTIVMEGGRPRLVPFTSSSRVPVPKLPSTYFAGEQPAPGSVKGRTKRVVSQMAAVFRSASTDRGSPREDPAQGGDELSVGIRYVDALGDNAPNAGTKNSDHSPSGSFSVESSHHGHTPPSPRQWTAVPRMLARAGERFKFRLPLDLPITAETPLVFDVRLMSGKKVPRFVQVDFDAFGGTAGPRMKKRAAEFSGVPQVRDVGELNIGVYEKTGGTCVGRVILEVLERSRGETPAVSSSKA